MSRVKVTVLSDASAPLLVLSFLPAFADSAGLAGADASRVRSVVETFVRFTLEHAYPDDELGEIEVTVEAAEDRVFVDVHDWGLPLTSAGGDLGPLPAELAALEPIAEGVQLLNLGAEGKRLTARVPVRAAAPADGRHHLDAAPARGRLDAHAVDGIELRRATPADAEGIAQLLYENYHLSYVHPDFYRPRVLMDELEAGRLVSAVAVHAGRVVGHHALMPQADGPSAESGVAVVHSAYRGLGIFNRLFGQTFRQARELGLAAVFGDAVTIHPFSQRAEASHGYRETALQLGMVPAGTTMRGFGPAGGPARRTPTLRSYLPLDRSPRAVELPSRYRELLERVYEHAGLQPGPRAWPAATGGETVAVAEDAARALGFLRLARWTEGTAAELSRSVRHLLARHADVVYADVDLAAVEEVDAAIDRLNELGFFVAGLVLFGPDGHDHVRLQLLDSEDVELEDVVCDSAFAQELHARVLEDRARVDG